MDSLPSLAQSQGIQIVGVNFHSINFQEPKWHIAVHFLFAKAREKVIFVPLIWISQVFGGIPRANPLRSIKLCPGESVNVLA